MGTVGRSVWNIIFHIPKVHQLILIISATLSKLICLKIEGERKKELQNILFEMGLTVTSWLRMLKVSLG